VRALEARLSCLSQRRAAFGATLDVLAGADTDTRARAIAIVLRLPPPECDARTLAELSTLDEGQRAHASLVRAELDRASVLLEGGRYADTLAAAEAAREQARALSHPPLVAEAEYMVGSALVFSARPSDAEPVLEEAAHLAEAIDDAELAARAATRLAFAHGVLGARPEEGLRWARHGRAMLARTRDFATEAALLTALTAVYEKAGDAEEAEVVGRRAVELWTRVEGSRGIEVAAARNNLGLALYGQGRFDDAIDEYQAVVTLRTEVLGPLHPDTGVSHNNLANALLEVRRTEDALAHHTRALEIWTASLGPEHPNVAAAWNNLGNAATHLGRLDEAEASYRASLRVREAVLPADHPDLASTVMNLGVVLSQSGDTRGALAEFRRAAQMLERSVGPEHRHVATCRANIAEMLRLEGDHEAALKMQREVVAMRERLLGPDHPELAAAELGLGFVLLDLDRPEEAAAALERAISIYARSGGDPTQRARAQLLLATATERTDLDGARALVREALATFSAHPGTDTERADAQAWLRAHPD
jgi:tetratricopeptide (TPR) repeat protein